MAGWGTCYSGSNNIHFNFPPIMADGRNYASWQPEAVINQRIQKEEDIKTESKFVDDLGADSLDLVELIMSFEDKFSIEISDEDAEKIVTVKDALDYIGAKTNK